MPVLVQDYLPAAEALKKERLFVMTLSRSKSQDIRPLKIALVNLMPEKIDTEIQFIRMLSNSPLQVELTLLHMSSHKSKNTPETHMKQFYKSLKQVENMRFDGMIITGAPVENLDFDEVNYWPELKELMEFTKSNVYSTIHVCWGAQAALKYHYGIGKLPLPSKCFGIFPHMCIQDNDNLFKGSNDIVYMPHSRHSVWDEDAIEENQNLEVILRSDKAGIALVSAHQARQVFISGHFEYEQERLANEYKRDVSRGLEIDIPKNYFPSDDASKSPVVTWRADGNLFFTNWLNFVVYQGTPFDLDKLEPIL